MLIDERKLTGNRGQDARDSLRKRVAHEGDYVAIRGPGNGPEE